MKAKERLKNCPRLEETRKMGQLAAVHNLDGILGHQEH
jgi:hypothetical protein